MRRLLHAKTLRASVAASALLLASWQAWAQNPAPLAGAASINALNAGLPRPKLSWAPPALADPITIEVSESRANLKLDQAKDYIIKMPSKPLLGGLGIWGGRNVVLIGGEIHIPSKEEAPDFKGSTRALYIQEQKGTAHIEGLLVSGKGLTEGVNLNQRQGATVQFQNVRFDTVHGSREAHHADLIQTWAGPGRLRIDRFTGHTSYQGFFLLPNQHFPDGPKPRLFDFRHMNIIGNDRAGYMLWLPDAAGFAVDTHDVWVSPNSRRNTSRDQFLWPKPSTGDKNWAGVKVGLPPEGDYVPEGSVGVNYVSPGYLEP